MKHVLDGCETLSQRALAAKLWIDGIAPDGTYQGDATKGPWVVFDINAQENIAGPFKRGRAAKSSLLKIINKRA